MFLNFLIEEKGQAPQITFYEGGFTVKDLEDIYTLLMDTSKEWFIFSAKPNGIITRKEYIKSVYLSEQKGVLA